MAEGLNRVIIVGNLCSDPELKFLPGGQANLKLRIAATESYLDRDKGKQDRTEFVNVIVWGKRGEGLSKILEKGRTVWVEGRLQTRSWEDKNGGGKRYATDVVANNIGLCGGKGGGGGGPRGGRQDDGGAPDDGNPYRADESDLPF